MIDLNKIGTASNTNTDNVEAVSYGLAKALKQDDYYVQNSKDFKNPAIVQKLPAKQPIERGRIETVEEVN